MPPTHMTATQRPAKTKALSVWSIPVERHEPPSLNRTAATQPEDRHRQDVVGQHEADPERHEVPSNHVGMRFLHPCPGPTAIDELYAIRPTR